MEDVLVKKYIKDPELGQKLQPKTEWRDHSH